MQIAANTFMTNEGNQYFANQVDPLVVLNDQIIALNKFTAYKCFDLRDGLLDEAQLFQYIQSKGLKLAFEYKGQIVKNYVKRKRPKARA